MKIFNWVHRRFHRKDGLGGSVKQTELVRNDNDTQVLLEHATLAKVVDGWRDGTTFLSIGTFGFEPLEDFINLNQVDKDEEDFDDDDDDDEYGIDGTADEDNYKEDDEILEEDEGELNPLILTSFRHGFDMENGEKTSVDDKDDVIMTTIDAMSPWPAPHVHDQLGSASPNYLEDERMRKKKAERTTLADLFSADSDDDDDDDANIHADDDPKFPSAEYCCKKAAVLLHHKNNGVSFAKKLLPRVNVAEDSRPILKLHRLMTRMLKRRIHPDFDGKIEKKDILGRPTDEYGATISLL